MRQIWAHCLAIVALVIGAPAAAQETRIGEEGFESPPATLAQIDWLVGQWRGEGIQGAPAMESWLPPSGGTMVGTFVQTTSADSSDQAIMFTEHMYLMEENGTLVLRLKHFNADLTGWEEKNDMLTFRLVAIEECAAYFNALTLRCNGKDGLVAAVRLKSGGELLFRFDRVMPPAPRSTACADAYTTIELNECHANLLAEADSHRERYFEAAIDAVRGTDDDFRKSVGAARNGNIIKQMRASKAAFEAQRDAECGAVYDKWSGGSIRGLMDLSCRIDMTDRRTLKIWENWLIYMDSTPALLPKPEPTR